MQTAAEIATEIVARRAGPMFYLRRSDNPQYRQDEIDEIAAALASYGDSRAAEARANCARLARSVGTAHTYSEQEYASGFAADDIVARIAAALGGA